MQTPNTPAQVPEEYANVIGLGAAQAVYLPGASNRWVSAILGLGLIAGAGLAVIYGLYDATVQTARYGPVLFSKTILFPAIIAVCLFFAGVFLAINAFQNWKKSAVVYEKGLAYHDTKGLQTWLWQEVEWLYVSITKHYRNGIYTGTTYQYTLRKANGARLVLNNKFKNIEVLGSTLNKKVFPYQYEKLSQAMRAGQTISLGLVAISSQNITLNKKSFAWSEVETVGINKGYVSVREKKGGWFSGGTVAASAIPNLDALLAVIDQIVKVKAG